MSNFYEMNDDNFRDKLTNHEFAKMPGAWEQMEKMLDATPATAVKKGVVIWWGIPIAAAALLTGIIGLGVYMNFQKENLNNTASLPLAKQTTFTATTKVKSSTKVAAQKIAVPSLNSISNTINTNSKTTKQPIVQRLQKSVTLAMTNTNKTTKTILTNPKYFSNTAATTSPPLSTDNPVVEQQALTVANQTTTTSKFPIKKTRTIIRYQYSSTPLKALQSRQNKLQQQLPQANAFGIGSPNIEQKKQFKVGVFAGISTKVIGSTQKLSITPNIGISTRYRLNRKHAIQTGLQYKSINLKGMPAADSDNLSYRSYKTTQSYRIDRLDFLEMPLVYEYNPHPKLQLQTGVKGAWLFDKQVEDKSTAKLSNNDLGLASIDLSVLFGVEYWVNKHISVGLQYTLGLQSLTTKAKQKNASEINNTDRAALNKLTDKGEIIVPVSTDKTIRLPQELRNNDLQLLVKYTF